MHMQVFLVYMILPAIYNFRTMGFISQMIVVDYVAGSFSSQISHIISVFYLLINFFSNWFSW